MSSLPCNAARPAIFPRPRTRMQSWINYFTRLNNKFPGRINMYMNNDFINKTAFAYLNRRFFPEKTALDIDKAIM